MDNIKLISAVENPWWREFKFSIEDNNIFIVYHQKSYDLYSYPDIGNLTKEVAQDIIRKLKELQSSEIIPVANI